ncbi:MAG TPA: hypothetical protein VGU46_10760 [Acidobacteriaceae bacterium]|nr:hypothetical protein [Acidobacteriaceae bacterium]
MPEDWSHHHAIFSDPGTFENAVKHGRQEHWNKIQNNPRFLMQRRIRKEWPLHYRPRKELKTDWSMNMGSGAKVSAGQYPATYSFSASTASCSDYVAYPTGVAGVSGGQANIVGYSNLYDTTCVTPVPSVSWAYYSGTGSALSSPVVSFDGTKLAYVENPTSGAAVLRILAWHSGEGSPTAAATPDKVYTNTTAGAVGNTAWNTTNCPTSGSCLISIAFNGGGQDKISSPFYLYDGSDTMFVGDASGKLHKFTGVFTGTPGEVTTGGWPITVSTNVLTSPVYDSGTTGNLFVADSGGFLYSYNASTAAHQMTSSKLTYASGTVGIVDGPIVDSTTEQVYVFVGDDANTSTSIGCDSATGCSGVFQFAANNTTQASGTACAATSTTTWPVNSNCGEESLFGVGSTAIPNDYDGAFDHIYLSGTGTTGNIWTCSEHTPVTGTAGPRLSYTTLQSNGGIVPAGSVIGIAGTAISNLTNANGASCSPVTEIWGSAGGTDDYLFMGVSASGSLTTTNAGAHCTGACVYNFVIATGGTATTAGTLTVPTTAEAGIAATGGSSGIVVDNLLSGSGESQIYYTPLSNMTCGGNGTAGSGTGGCAVQTSQTVP